MLKVRALRGTLLNGGITLGLRPINTIATVILVRLLSAQDFGLVALAMLPLASSYLFTGLGLGDAIIHTEIDRDEAARQAFPICLLSGLLFYLLAFFGAGQLAEFLGDMTTVPIIQWLSLIILLNALAIVPHALLNKELYFERISMITLIVEVVYLIVALLLAYLGYGLWSLVYAYLLRTLIETGLSWILSPSWGWLKFRRLDFAILKSLLSYGMHSMLSGFVSYLHTHWDDWLVGRYFGSIQLGYYNKAYELSNKTLANFTGMITYVFFPMYVQLRDDSVHLARIYLKSYRTLLMIIVPLALGLALVAHELVIVLFGSEWLPMVPLFQIYSVMVLTRPISTNSSPLFMALGHPEYNTRAGVLLFAAMAIVVWFLFPMKAVGIAIAVAVAHTVGALYNIYQVNGLLPGTAKKTLATSWPLILAGVVMSLAIYFTKPLLLQMNISLDSVLALLILIVVGGVSYGTIVLITQWTLIKELVQMVFTSVGIPRGNRPVAI